MARKAHPTPAELEHDRAQLSGQEWTVISRYMSDQSVKSIASELGIAESTVYSYKHRAEDKLDGDQLRVTEKILRQQQDAERPENIVHILENAADRLRSMGIEVNVDVGEFDE